MILQPARAQPVEPAVCRVAALIALLLAGIAAAQEPLRYRLEVIAPAAMAQKLREGLSLARWKDDPQMTPEQVRRLAEVAVRETRETAATEGYFSPVVEVSIDDSRTPWTVRVLLEPGPRTVIGEIDIQFSGPVALDPEAEWLRRRVRTGWTLRRGEPFRQEQWEAAKRNAVRELSTWRYPAAHLGRTEALIDPKAQRARLTVELASGPPYRFGEVRVRGLRRYSPSLVENQSAFRAGDVYDRDRLVIYQRRLLESGYFVSAQAEVDREGEPHAAPVDVAVIEAPRQHVEAGLGYSTDVGPRVELRYSNQDVFNSAWRFRSALEVDDKIQSLQLDADSPPLPGARWNSFFTRMRQTDIQNEFTRELAVGASHNWSGDLSPSSLIVSGHLEEQRVAGDATDNRHAVYFGYRRAFRRTDDLTFPRSGYLASFEIGGAPPALASRAFLRAVASGSLLIPNGRRGDLLLRAEVGRVVSDSREGIPTSFLFRTGGDLTVRGYAFESLGVRQGDAIVGGRELLVGSVEYTHWVTQAWGVAAFVDAGDAWDADNELRAAVGVGFGARFRTPIGPIRADLAYGERTGEVRLHFSVGYTF